MNLRAIQGDTVDAMCWRFYGQTEGMVEAVLEANQGLAEHGAVLPIGLLVTMPEISTKTTTQTNLIQLWD
jgi:phage tail protein X